MSTALTYSSAADADDGVRLIELPDDARDPSAAWGVRGADLLSAHAGVIDTCAGMLAAAERRGIEAGRREGFRDAMAVVPGVLNDLIAAGRDDLGGLTPTALRSLVPAVAARLLAHQPAEPLGERLVEGGLGI
jgi:hypothetical protein